MKPSKQPNLFTSMLPYLLAASVFVALTLIRDAKAFGMFDCGDEPPHPAMQNGMPVPPGDSAESKSMGGHPRMWEHRAPFADLNLSEAQQKQVKAITEAERTTVCEKHKALRANMQALHQLAAEDSFDSAQARILADAQGKLLADMAFQRTETQAKIWAILSKEQRQKLEEQRKRWFGAHQ